MWAILGVLGHFGLLNLAPLNYTRHILDRVYVHPVGMGTAMHLFLCDKSAILKHPNVGSKL